MPRTAKDIQEMIEVVTLALPRERDAVRFYTRAAEISKSEEARRLFHSLAQQEEIHEKVLKDLLRDLKKELAELGS